MARVLKLTGVEPKRNITLPTDLTFAENTANGHASAGRALAVGTIAGGAVLGTDGAKLLGQLVLLERDGLATVQTMGVLRLPITGTAAEAGDAVVCAASGAVRVADPVADAANARGMVLPLSAGDGYVYVEV